MEKAWNAAHLIDKLQERHANDQFVAEVQLGSSFRGCRRMDAWAMKKSWSPITTIGYEVKVSRNDFMRDEKWPGYVPYVHQLWFACPYGLIQPEELPQGVGLLWLTKNGKSFRAKRKAARQEVDQQKASDLWLYLLMTRAELKESSYGLLGRRRPGLDRSERIERWRQRLEEHREGKVIGLEVACRVSNTMRQLKEENLRLRSQLGSLERLAETLRSHGISPENAWSVDQFERKLDGVPRHAVRAVVGDLRRLLVRVEALASDDQ